MCVCTETVALVCGPATNVACLFLIKTFFPPINLLRVSKLPEDPSFGEIRVRMNILRQGDASIFRCFGEDAFAVPALAMP